MYSTASTGANQIRIIYMHAIYFYNKFTQQKVIVRMHALLTIDQTLEIHLK